MNFKAAIKKIDPIYFLILIYVVWIITLKNRDDGGFTDFNVFFNAGRRMLIGENIYTDPHLFGLKYFYSPLFAWLMAMVQGLGLYGAKDLWFVVTGVIFWRTMVLVKNRVPQDVKGRTWLFLIIMILMSKIVMINYISHQMTVFLLWTILEAFDALEKKKYWLSALVLCLGINFKILPLVVAPYFLFIAHDKIKYLIAGICTLAFYLFIPALFVGWDYNLSLISEWAKTLNPASKIHVMQTYEYGFLDISSLVTKYLSDEPVYKEPVLNIAAWSMGALFALTNLIRIACLAGAVWLVFKVKKPLFGFHQHYIIAAAFMALAPLCFPHQREYSFFLYLPLWLIFLYASVRSRKVSWLLTFVVCALLSGLLTWVDFVGQDVVDIFNFYRITTFGMLCMYVAFVLAMVRMAREESMAQESATK